MSSRVGFMESDWANLPEHLLYLVLERLEILSNFLQFSLVCTSWLHVAKDNRSLAKLLARHHQPPMLLIPSDRENTWNVYNMMNNKVLDIQINLPMKRFCGTPKGWLVLVEKDFSVTLLNPFSRIIGREEEQNSTIRLPPLPASYTTIGSAEQIGGSLKAMISGDPMGDAEDCVVVVTCQKLNKVSFFRIGKDITWTTASACGIEEVLYTGDKFYGVIGVGSLNMLISFDTTTHNTRSISQYVKAVKLLDAPRDLVHLRRYIVDLNENKLIMVHRYMIMEACGKIVTEKFRIFELDKFEWVEIGSLGDAALFVGDMNTISVLASSFPGCQPDCIYFNHDNLYLACTGVCLSDINYDDLGVYNMKTKSISKPFSRDATTLVEKTKLPPVWVVPTFRL